MAMLNNQRVIANYYKTTITTIDLPYVVISETISGTVMVSWCHCPGMGILTMPSTVATSPLKVAS